MYSTGITICRCQYPNLHIYLFELDVLFGPFRRKQIRRKPDTRADIFNGNVSLCIVGKGRVYEKSKVKTLRKKDIDGLRTAYDVKMNVHVIIVVSREAWGSYEESMGKHERKHKVFSSWMNDGRVLWHIGAKCSRLDVAEIGENVMNGTVTVHNFSETVFFVRLFCKSWESSVTRHRALNNAIRMKCGSGDKNSERWNRTCLMLLRNISRHVVLSRKVHLILISNYREISQVHFI